jgi:hypothetical protein
MRHLFQRYTAGKGQFADWLYSSLVTVKQKPYPLVTRHEI